MKNLCFIILVSLLFGGCQTDRNILLQTQSMELHISNTGYINGIVDLETGDNHIATDSTSPLLSYRIDGVMIYPTKISYVQDKSLLELSFHDSVNASIGIRNDGDYISFELLSITNIENIELIVWGPLSTTINKVIGETVGVVQSNNFALGIQALNPKTLGGYPWKENDCMPQIDLFEGTDMEDLSEKNKPYVLYRVEAAKPTSYGSTLQAYTRKRNTDRVVENWGHQNYLAPAWDDGGIIGSSIALFGVSTDQVLSVIEKIELNENLPHPLIDGVWSKRSNKASSSYLIMDFGEQDIEKAIEITRKSGLKYLYHSGPFESWGNFKLKETQFTDQLISLKRCVNKADKAGISLGLHTLSNFITSNDSYVTPIPDSRLAKVGSTTIVQDLDSGATEIILAETDYFTSLDKCHMKTVQIGNELIRFGSISHDEPWILFDCQRGAFGTQKQQHSANSTISLLADHAYKVFLSNSDLTLEIGENIARIFNETGIRQISFDGLEGCRSTGLGNYGEILLTSHWYDNLSADIQQNFIADASRTSHYFWHIYSRMNWGEPWYAGFRESQQEYRLKNQNYFRRNLMPGMLGWFLMSPSTSIEDMEWLLARAAGYDAGFAFVTNYKTVEKHGKSGEVLETIGKWENLRMSGLIPDSLKSLLQDIDKEFELSKAGKEQWKITPVGSFKFEYANLIKQPGEPLYTSYKIESPLDDNLLHFTISAKESDINQITVEIDNYKEVTLIGIKAGQTIEYKGGSTYQIYDQNWHLVAQIGLMSDELLIGKGEHTLNVSCAFDDKNKGTAKIEFRLANEAILISKESNE
jgi:hypothetical protein